MADRWIVDASPLIALAKVGQTSLLQELSAELLIPGAVAEEVHAGLPDDPARLLLESGLGEVISPRDISPRLSAWSLGRGETEVLALGLERQGTTVVIDDAAARRCASALHVPMIGTLGVVVRARRLGKIVSAAAVFRSLREAGFHLDERTIRRVVGGIGEHW